MSYKQLHSYLKNTEFIDIFKKYLGLFSFFHFVVNNKYIFLNCSSCFFNIFSFYIF